MKIPKELQEAIEEFERRKLWGSIQLDYQSGTLVTWRQTVTRKTFANENFRNVKEGVTHESQFNR